MQAKFLNKCSESIQNLLFPCFCILCEQPSDSSVALCHDCQSALPRITNACDQCGLPIEGTLLSGLCGQCLTAPTPACERLNSLWCYEGFIREWVIQAKFFQKRHRLKPLSQLLGQAIRQRHLHSNLEVCLVPVPLHPSRQRQRGFNQSFEIARFLQKEAPFPIRKDLVKKNRATPAQAALSLKRRKSNVQNAFGAQTQSVKGTCLIIDDVITSGQTIEAIAKILKAAGAEKVEAWSLARTLQTASV